MRNDRYVGKYTPNPNWKTDFECRYVLNNWRRWSNWQLHKLEDMSRTYSDYTRARRERMALKTIEECNKTIEDFKKKDQDLNNYYKKQYQYWNTQIHENIWKLTEARKEYLKAYEDSYNTSWERCSYMFDDIQQAQINLSESMVQMIFNKIMMENYVQDYTLTDAADKIQDAIKDKTNVDELNESLGRLRINGLNATDISIGDHFMNCSTELQQIKQDIKDLSIVKKKEVIKTEQKVLLNNRKSKNEILAQNIKLIRLRMCETQSEFGKRFGVSRKTISNYENGVYQPKLHVLKQMSQMVDIPADMLTNKKINN